LLEIKKFGFCAVTDQKEIDLDRLI